MPRGCLAVLKAHGHEAVYARDVGLGTSPDVEIARHALDRGLCLLTVDFDFGDIRNYPPGKYHGIVVLELATHQDAPAILRLLEAFLGQDHILERLPGRLAVVSSRQIRLRPA
jgi:predicted nuclease of predicted toxin-antitoxin system